MIFVGSMHSMVQVTGTISTGTTWTLAATSGSISTPTPTPVFQVPQVSTPTPQPTPSPTPKIMPGSPLSLGGSTFAEAISQFDLTKLAELVFVGLGIIWLIVILFYVDGDFVRKEIKKSKY